MAYSKTTWANGDVITAAKLNNMENGIADASAVMIISVDGNDTLDKTWQEIHDAVMAGVPVVCEYTTVDNETFTDTVTFVANISGGYVVNMASEVTFKANTANDYPVSDK